MRRKWFELTDIPAELNSNGSRITMNGNGELFLDNCKGVLEYNESCVILKLLHGKLEIYGNDLCIYAYSKQGTVIRGCILSIQFM